MRFRVKIVMIGAMILTLACLVSGGGPATAEEIVLKWSNFFAPVHPLYAACQAWGKDIEEQSGGRVKFTWFPGGSLFKGPEIYDGVVTGGTDIGLSVFGYNRGRFPAMETLALPMGYTSAAMATSVANAFYDKFKPKELDEVVVLNLHGHGGGVLHSKKKIETLEDVKGLKIRGNAFNAKVAKALGAVPVAIPMPGAFEALQKGVVDASFSPIETLMSWKHAEILDYTVESTVIGYTSIFYMVMNKKSWDDLPDDIKEIFIAASKKHTPLFAKVWDDLEAKAREYSLKQGHQFVQLDDKEAARWAEVVQPVIAEYVEYADKKGLPGQEYVDFVREQVDNYKK